MGSVAVAAAAVDRSGSRPMPGPLQVIEGGEGRFAAPEAIPPKLRRFFTNQRILVVEDDPDTARDIKRDLSRYSSAGNGNSVEVMTDAEAARDRIIRAHGDGRPYTLLLLDLFTKLWDPVKKTFRGINGDRLLRDITRAGAFVPAVVNSGSHAKDLQLPLREELDKVHSLQELALARGWLSAAAKGMPLASVLKYADRNPAQRLAIALASAALIGGGWTSARPRAFSRPSSPRWWRPAPTASTPTGPQSWCAGSASGSLIASRRPRREGSAPSASSTTSGR